MENSKDATKKTIRNNIEHSKVAGHKINIQESVAFLHVTNEPAERN